MSDLNEFMDVEFTENDIVESIRKKSCNVAAGPIVFLLYDSKNVKKPSKYPYIWFDDVQSLPRKFHANSKLTSLHPYIKGDLKVTKKL